MNTCTYFKHIVNPHEHGCTHPRSQTSRCGFEIVDWRDCPLIYQSQEFYKESYGLQIVKRYGILQIVYSMGELHTTLRNQLTDRYPIFEHIAPDGENHQFGLYIEANLGIRRIGYLVIDAESYGEVEVYVSRLLHLKMEEHHRLLGLKVKYLGVLMLKRMEVSSSREYSR